MDDDGWNALRKRMKKHDYPANQSFDPELFPLQLNRRINHTQIGKYLTFHKESLLDVGSNKGMFSLCNRHQYNKILGIDAMKEMVQIANDIRDAHALKHINFLCVRFEQFDTVEKFDVVHFGQCAHYLFRDAFRRNVNPLSFLVKAKKLAMKYIAIDGAFDGDPSVEFDAVQDKWSPIVKRMATIEGYARQLRPEFKLIKYGWSGDGPTRYMAIFERISQ